MRQRFPLILRGCLLILGCALVAAPAYSDEVDDFVRATMEEQNIPGIARSEEHTEYYHDEMGENLERHFLAFSRLIHPEALADIKRDTNDLEQRLGEDLALPAGCRSINLDPGYMSLSKLVLATTKD